MYKITSRWPHQDSIKVEWNLGKRCNLDCSYCPVEIHDNFSPHTDISILENVVNKLTALDKPVRISLTGGEPCVHPKIESLLWYMRPRIKWINVTSNATRTANFYNGLPVNHLVFSLHFEDPKWKDRLHTILEFEELNAGRIPFNVHVMAHHKHMKNVQEAATALALNKISCSLRRIRWSEKHDWFDDMKYEPEDLDWLLKAKSTAESNVIIDDEIFYHANDIIKEHKNQFEGWRCAAGVESLMINWDGEVHRATCRVGGSLGNIYEGTFIQPTEWVTCSRKWCTCAADIPLSKEKND